MKSSKHKKNRSYLGRVLSISKRFFILVLLYFVYSLTLGRFLEKTIESSLVSLSHNYGFNIQNKLDAINKLGSTATNELYSTVLNKDELASLTSNTQISTLDPKVLAMRKFLIDYDSPMYPYADVFVYEADSSGLDWRLVASISLFESAFGNLIPYRSNNAWGWKGGPNGDFSIFTSWTQGVKTLTKGLAEGYGVELTPFQIEPTYCPPCGRNPQHAWANGVVKYMGELNMYLNNLENF